MQDFGDQCDSALNDVSEDCLERGAFVKSLMNALVVDVYKDNSEATRKKSTGYIVGLTGQWGLGKSSVLNFTYNELEKEKWVIAVKFNPWLFKSTDELLYAFFDELATKIRQRGDKKLLKLLLDYWYVVDLAALAFGSKFGLHGIFYKASRAVQGVGKLWAKPKTLEERKKALEDGVKVSKYAIVILIDELDRVEDNEVKYVAQLIKAVGDISGISYLVAYDSHRVCDALGRGGGKLEWQMVRCIWKKLSNILFHSDLCLKMILKSCF